MNLLQELQYIQRSRRRLRNMNDHNSVRAQRMTFARPLLDIYEQVKDHRAVDLASDKVITVADYLMPASRSNEDQCGLWMSAKGAPKHCAGFGATARVDSSRGLYFEGMPRGGSPGSEQVRMTQQEAVAALKEYLADIMLFPEGETSPLIWDHRGGHLIRLVGEGQLAVCERCRGGEVELETPCVERLADKVRELKAVDKVRVACLREVWQVFLDYAASHQKKADKCAGVQQQKERLEKMQANQALADMVRDTLPGSLDVEEALRNFKDD